MEPSITRLRTASRPLGPHLKTDGLGEHACWRWRTRVIGDRTGTCSWGGASVLVASGEESHSLFWSATALPMETAVRREGGGRDEEVVEGGGVAAVFEVAWADVRVAVRRKDMIERAGALGASARIHPPWHTTPRALSSRVGVGRFAPDGEETKRSASRVADTGDCSWLWRVRSAEPLEGSRAASAAARAAEKARAEARSAGETGPSAGAAAWRKREGVSGTGMSSSHGARVSAGEALGFIAAGLFSPSCRVWLPERGERFGESLRAKELLQRSSVSLMEDGPLNPGISHVCAIFYCALSLIAHNIRQKREYFAFGSIRPKREWKLSPQHAINMGISARVD